MRYKMISEYGGVVAMGVACVAMLWLGATDQLTLYIHPRYVIFTIVMAVFGLVFSAASITIRSGHVSSANWLGMSITIGLIIGMMIIVKPHTLGAAIASQRVVNSSTALDNTYEEALLADRGDYSQFSVKDWAALLAQSDDPKQYAHKAVHVSGFVTPSSDTVFFVSRFVVSCCVVDARPIGLPVYRPGWRQEVKADTWVEISGELAPNPQPTVDKKTVVVPDYIKTINKPEQPYVY